MRIEIYSEKLGTDFCEWLISILSNQIKGSIDDKKLIRWNEYLSSGGAITLVGRKSILAKEIIFKGANSIIVRELPNKFIIEINSKVMMPGVKSKKVSTLCRLINYGNMDIKGYPIFSDTFAMVADNINAYIDLYALENNRGDSYGS